ncbi:MAG: hypothetical protein AABX40_05695 [Candidatus Hydrothermarchaeota archaeon]
MKVKIKVSELIDILIQKRDNALLRKYNLDSEKVHILQESLRTGDWRFVG